MNEPWSHLGFGPADVLLPREEAADLTRWSVVACDQYTSEPEYWQRVEQTVGDAPSALKLILPEQKLSDGHTEEHIAAINAEMPGVSSFCGAAAALCAEYTLPNVSQTVIITRMEGRTPVPEAEQLAKLAAHGATMVIFLSIGLVDKVQQALLESGGYRPDTPAAVVYKATWPEQKVVRCTVSTLAEETRKNGITKTALIVVGDFLGENYERSKLYDPAFTTEFRQGTEAGQ